MAYVELELRGPGDRAVGFVEGFRAARSDSRPVWYSRRDHVGQESLVETLREKLGRASHCILPADLARAVTAAVAASPLLELEVAAEAEVEAAELPFTFHCFSRTVAAEIQRLVEQDLPAGIRLEGYGASEKVDAAAHGAELYSPVHEYTLAGEGHYVGPVEGVLALADRLRGHDFVHLGSVRLHRRP